MTNKNYFDVLNIAANREAIDMIQALLGNKCLGTLFQPGTGKLYFDSGAREHMNAKLEELLSDQTIQWTWETLTSEDWHLVWQDHFKPVVINKKLAVIPYWWKNHPAEISIKIKPGMAFGTGHHETTWLMLSQIIKYLQPGMSVLDLGTGSGILSIAAKKLGASNVDAVDNDADCMANFYENLGLNKVTESIQFHHCNVSSWTHLDYNLIMANINRNVIEEFIPNLKEINAKVILSGLLESDDDAISKVCRTNRLTITEKIIKDEWLCIIITP